MREYIDVRGTEKAYDSGRWIGRSIRTTSVLTKPMSQRVRKMVGGKNIPSSSCSWAALSSILTNLSHSALPFSFNSDSGIQASKYVGFCASYILISLAYELDRRGERGAYTPF